MLVLAIKVAMKEQAHIQLMCLLEKVISIYKKGVKKG